MIKPLRVLIADNHPLIRIAVVKLLSEKPGMELRQAGSIPGLFNALEKGPADVLILGLDLPGGNSLDAIAESRRLYPLLAILVLSSHSEREAGVKSILAGANGYLDKASPPEDLIKAVELVAAGGRSISPVLGAILADYLVHAQATPGNHPLSAREHTVLLKIARGFTTVKIATQLNLSPKTVGTYRARILEKLGISTTAELTRYVLEKGLDEIPRFTFVNGSNETGA